MRAFGKYRLVEPLASGGMADLWRAEVSGAEGVVKEVALKLVRGEHAAQGEFVRMFIEEARLASRLSHANVVQVFEFDQVDGRYYLAMELVRGHHLGRVMERARELGLKVSLPCAVHACAEVAKGLAYAHRLAEGGRPVGLVHRDVSPHNVLVSFEGEVKLADFGIARVLSRAEVTAPGTLKGKLAYMAPEQARGAPVDARADVFALGVVLWELCAGRRLFARDEEAATLAALLNGPPPSPPSAWNEAVPPELDAAVLGALEADPARRTPSADALGAALGRVLLRIAGSPEDWDLRSLMHRLFPEGASPAAGPRLDATRVQPSPGPAPAEGAEPTAATRTARAARPHRGLRVGALALAGILGLAGGWLAVRAFALRRPAVRPGPAPAAPAAALPASTASAVVPASLPAPAAEPPAPAPGRGPGAEAPGTGPAAPAPAAPSAAPGEAPSAADRARGEEGSLEITSSPWGYAWVGERNLGETPVTVRLPAGPHRLRVTRPGYRAREAVVEVRPGVRASWHARLSR
ncbi:MAG TPA: serine/threonine-protein kinase [Anaeromyxobacter sp.]|nr:serine/threonine-protein kinase [Anaeromyxobacter sp.]